jgi:hypothetical protein
MTQTQQTLKNKMMLKVAVIMNAKLKKRPGFAGFANE